MAVEWLSGRSDLSTERSYSSIPQRSRGQQKLAIASLAAYASVAHAFVIVAPPVIHADTKLPCNVSTYNKRMWCRAENLAHSLRNGTHDMWVATGEGKGDCVKQKDDADFLRSNLHVFQGEATVEADKVTLVTPILGLYAELYATMLVQAGFDNARLNDNLHGKETGKPPASPVEAAQVESCATTTVDIGSSVRVSTEAASVGEGSGSPPADLSVAAEARTSTAVRVSAAEDSTLTAKRWAEREMGAATDLGTQAWLAERSARAFNLKGRAREALKKRKSLCKLLIEKAEEKHHTSEMMHSIEEVMRIVLECKEAMFPRVLKLATALPGATNATTSSSASGSNSDNLVTVELFGPLIERMEQLLSSDHALCQRLVDQQKMRRDATGNRSIDRTRTAASKLIAAALRKRSMARAEAATAEAATPGMVQVVADAVATKDEATASVTPGMVAVEVLRG